MNETNKKYINTSFIKKEIRDINFKKAIKNTIEMNKNINIKSVPFALVKLKFYLEEVFK